MNTLKIKFNLREKVKGRHPVAVLQEHIDNLFYDPFNFEFEDGDIIGLKEKLNAFSNDPYFESIIPRKIDELRKGYFYITATVMLERDGEDVGFVCQHIDSTLHACKKAILVEGEDNDFDILNLFFKNRNKKYTQREISSITKISLGKVNKTLKELKNNEFIDENLKITDKGLSALEPYKVDNAIIMAAGMSSRFAPLCYETPKGLLNVKGEKLIEREILQLKEAGIEDITLVVGYMKEKMFYLAEKFGVDIVVNEDYYRFNNTSSLILVTEKLKNTYICSSDNYFPKNPFEKYVYRAYYSAVYQYGETDEYYAEFDKKGRITGVTIGGKDDWIMLGHVFFDREFSDKFVKLLKAEYHEQIVRENLWETFYMRHIKELDNMYIRKYDLS